MYKRSAGILVLLLVLLVSLSLWSGCGDRQENTLAPSGPQQTAQVLSRGNPAVEATIAVQERHADLLLSIPDVVGTGVGADKDGTPVLLVLTRQEGVRNIPAQLEGVRTRVDVVGDVIAMAGFTKTYRPVPCGVSTGNANECSAGTIGCMVNKGGVLYALSNNHVFARENDAAIGERINQPGRYDGKPRCAQTGQIATLSAFRPIVFSTSATNVIDAAIAQFSPGVATTCSMVNNLYTPSSTIVQPSVGLAVKKVGRTSGLTTGRIAGINVTINVGYSSGTARFENQIYVASSFIRSGDSGSMMVTQNGNNPVGLNFAGGGGASFANPMSEVLAYFSATVCGQ